MTAHTAQGVEKTATGGGRRELDDPNGVAIGAPVERGTGLDADLGPQALGDDGLALDGDGAGHGKKILQSELFINPGLAFTSRKYLKESGFSKRLNGN